MNDLSFNFKKAWGGYLHNFIELCSFIQFYTVTVIMFSDIQMQRTIICNHNLRQYQYQQYRLCWYYYKNLRPYWFIKPVPRTVDFSNFVPLVPVLFIYNTYSFIFLLEIILT